jgi:nitrate/nitrite-specific signal transduction histidine kinase
VKKHLHTQSIFARPPHLLRTIRSRLIFWFVVLALTPAVTIAAGTVAVDYFNGRQQALERLSSVAALKESQVQQWLDSTENEMRTALSEEYALERARSILEMSDTPYYTEYFKKSARFRLQINLEDSASLVELAYLDLGGVRVLSTGATLEGSSYFLENITLPEAGEVSLNTLEIDYIDFLLPVTSQEGTLLGLMLGRASLEQVNAFLEERTGLGGTGRAYLVGLDNHVLAGAAGSSATAPLHSPGIDTVLTTRQNDSAVYRAAGGQRVIGVARWMAGLDAALLVEQNLSEAFTSILTGMALDFVVVFLTIFLSISASLGIARSISTPVTDLSRTASSIAAGDLETHAAEGDDEIGALAHSFNSMTAQLRDLINGLEQRVEERTRDLQQRALQLEASASVSREITKILNIGTLLESIVDLIQRTFEYYEVDIYLVDISASQLALRAASGVARPMRDVLPLDENSLNGKAVTQNQALLVNDVMQSPHFLADPHLPETRAELIVPLRIGDQIIGTLDVQASQVNAFNPQEIIVLQSLGDQIAIAIENARLYAESQKLAALEERGRLARELHDSVNQAVYSLGLLLQGWTKMTEQGKEVRVQDVLEKSIEINQQVLREMRLLIHELRPPDLEIDGLLNALQKRLDTVENRAGLQARLLAEDLTSLPPSIEEAFYRIALEALNNTLKHSAAARVLVRFYQQQGSIWLEVSDDGCGFDPHARTGGLGLVGMRERAGRIGAAIEILSSSGSGTLVRLGLPLEKTKEAL